MAIIMNDLEKIVSDALDEFYRRRIDKLSKLKLIATLKKKNPYLFRAIGMQDASEIVENLLAAYMSSSDEGIFGDAFFEPVAKHACGGCISPTEGVDIAIDSETKYTAIAVKSGPAVFNAQSKKKQEENFKSLQSRLQKTQKHFEAIVGYCYGRKQSAATGKKMFNEMSGQILWKRLTGDEDFYLKIIWAMKNKPLEHKQQYIEEWIKAKNRFTREFLDDFCMLSGEINWDKILKLNSGAPE